MARNKTFIIVLSLFIALVMFTKHMDQCCETFADSSVVIADMQIDDDNHLDADEPVFLSGLIVPFHPVLSITPPSTLVSYNQPDLPVTLKPPRV